VISLAVVLLFGVGQACGQAPMVIEPDAFIVEHTPFAGDAIVVDGESVYRVVVSSESTSTPRVIAVIAGIEPIRTRVMIRGTLRYVGPAPRGGLVLAYRVAGQEEAIPIGDILLPAAEPGQWCDFQIHGFIPGGTDLLSIGLIGAFMDEGTVDFGPLEVVDVRTKTLTEKATPYMNILLGAMGLAAAGLFVYRLIRKPQPHYGPPN
jgi:hypothetical protein